MLKGISGLISPDLLKILAEMGHGDEIAFGDSNFPASYCTKHLIRADGHSITALLDAILPLFPLDYASEYSAILMKHNGEEPKVWNAYKGKLNEYPEGYKPFMILSKPEFYERVTKVYCLVATSESEGFANIIIRKGVIRYID